MEFASIICARGTEGEEVFCGLWDGFAEDLDLGKEQRQNQEGRQERQGEGKGVGSAD